MTIMYYSRNSLKQFIQGKPICFGYKLWALWGSEGYCYNFSLYCGKESDTRNDTPLDTRVGSRATGSIRENRINQECPLEESKAMRNCQVIYSQFGLAIHQNNHQARRRFVEWAQNEIAVVPDFHKRILFSDEAHFWLNGYVNKQNCRIWSEANPQVYVETPLHPEKLTVWCALWAGGILLQKR
ncbi:zinc finger protein [Trichonephila clavipes]|nr:zinc finger protein [Trichonephila clavipes]